MRDLGEDGPYRLEDAMGRRPDDFIWPAPPIVASLGEALEHVLEAHDVATVLFDGDVITVERGR